MKMKGDEEELFVLRGMKNSTSYRTYFFIEKEGKKKERKKERNEEREKRRQRERKKENRCVDI